jgi:hypothetical protein
MECTTEPQACGLRGRTQRRGIVQKNGRFPARFLERAGQEISSLPDHLSRLEEDERRDGEA